MTIGNEGRSEEPLTLKLLDEVTQKLFLAAWLVDGPPANVAASMAMLDLWYALGEVAGHQHVPDWVHVANAAVAYGRQE